jgi:branched-subunit amino acid aminotransferase/4-amino-4-deoxychorismate lyase
VLGLCASLEIAVEEAEVTREQLRAADEIFLTNSLMEISPVRRLDQRELFIGPVTKRLMEAYVASTPR